MANAFARDNSWNTATTLTVSEYGNFQLGETKNFGHRKKSNGQYVPNSYLSNFGWKNTYYQHAVCEVKIPISVYLFFGGLE